MRKARLFFSSPEIDADLFYIGRFSAPDPFLALDTTDGIRIAVVSALEFGRARSSSSFTDLFDVEVLNQELRELTGKENIGIPDQVRFLAEKFRISALSVSPHFPVGLFNLLQDAALPLQVGSEPFVPERLIKSTDEMEAIREANRISAAGIRRAEEILRSATFKDDTLRYAGELLTSEILRREIEIACLREGGRADHTIAAGGRQACDPHEVGHGPIRPNELIIVDVFPRSTFSGYFGDMTRTFLKGQPSEAQVKLVETVFAVQQEAIRSLRSNVNGREARETCLRAFEDAGYPTRRTTDGNEGFFHGLGHGLGLEIHESPSIGRKGETLAAGMVVTVEPGLYYPAIGGCRFEDVVAIGRDSVDLLSEYPYDWILA